MDLRSIRIGYAPYDPSLSKPGDRCRFPFYARRRGLHFEMADPAETYDLVVLSARADVSAWARYRPGHSKVVYDLIDSYFSVPPGSLKSVLRGPAKFITGELSRPALSYRRAMTEMCRRADAVVCSTEAQRTQILRYSDNVHPILDFHSHLIRAQKTDYSLQGDGLNLVWLGLPENLSAFTSIVPVLTDLARDMPVALHVITDLTSGRFLGRYWAQQTDRQLRRLFERSFLYEWNEAMLSPIAVACDLGVIPITPGDPLAQAKPENKLLLLWRMGVPTLVSATPAYIRTMGAAGVDMACRTNDDWAMALRRYASNEEARRTAGHAGSRYSEEEHGEDQVLARWDRMFASLS